MVLLKRLGRWSLRVAAGLFVLALCLAALVAMQQRLLRWRAERLLADMQAIELHKTTWAQAQVLMHRWGAWGHYDGACTAAECKYQITMSDESSSLLANIHSDRVWDAIRATHAFTVYEWLGGRPTNFFAGFIVQDGTMRRTFLCLRVDVPPRTLESDDEYGYELIAVAQSRSSLNEDAREPGTHWILGDDEQLAEHPYYKGGRPGGCEICMSAEVTYSIMTPQTEIRRLTSFDLSCLTRWRPCTRIEDLLPAAWPWHLYWLQGDPPEKDWWNTPLNACDIPIWALGRDAIGIVGTQVLSTESATSPYDGVPFQRVTALVTDLVKGPVPWQIGSRIAVYPHAARSEPPKSPAETMEVGHRYFALAAHSFDQTVPGGKALRAGMIDGVPGVRLDRCGVLDDTPQNRAELARGIAQNDALRVPEF